jgi:hypothetical protein
MSEYYQLPYFSELQFCSVCLDKYLWPFDLPDGDERRNILEY